MNKLGFAAVAVMSFGFAQVVSAADLPVKAAPMQVIDPGWAGVYLGVNAGWGGAPPIIRTYSA